MSSIPIFSLIMCSLLDFPASQLCETVSLLIRSKNTKKKKKKGHCGSIGI